MKIPIAALWTFGVIFGAAAHAADDAAEWVDRQRGLVGRNAGGTITSVDLTSAWISNADLHRLAGLPHLERITLAATKITDLGLEHLKSLTGVVEFDCRFCEYVTDDGIAHLKGWKKLERLNLRGTKVTSKVFEHVAALGNLRSLDIAHTQIEDEGVEHLAGLAQLEHLAIGGNRLEGSALAALKLLPALRSLDVGGIQRVDSGLWGLALTDANLARIGELSGLRVLELAGANLADRGLDRPGHPEAERSDLRDLNRLRSLESLEKLDLSRLPVSGEALDAIRSLPRLRDLRLAYCRKVTDEIAMEMLSQLPRLEVAYLSGTQVTAGGVEKLGALRPGVKIVWSAPSSTSTEQR